VTYLLLLVNAEGGATTSQLTIRQLREFPGNEGLSVHFRPVRNDLLFESAKFAGRLAYRILSGEGVVRSQLWVEYEVLGAHINVTGRSSDLLFALALVTSKWKLTNIMCPAIAATGVLDAEGRVHSVEHAPEKIAAAVREVESTSKAVIFYPAADTVTVELWRATSEVPAHIELQPVGHIEDALTYLGYTLEKVYLRNPFRGLEHFDYEHHSIFFGRERETREVMKQLLRREASGVPGLLVEGASGSGKSSFLRAGVLPALVDLRFQADEVQDAILRRPITLGVRHAIWRPGLLPSGAHEGQIALSIRACWAALTEIHSIIESSEVLTLAALARQRHEYWPETKRFVWLIDQFEEFFDTGLARQTIDAFGQFLKQLQLDGVWTLASMRADAVPTLKAYESLRDIFGANEGQYYLATLSGPALDDVINRPAKAADLTFGLSPDGKPMDQLLREDAYREKDSLPLLQFALNELYQKRSGKELTFACYQQLGGLAGSIATTAEAILKDEAAESQRTAPRLFRSLVSVDEFGRATRRYAPMAEIAEDVAQARLADRLVEARLCVTDQRDGHSVVAFAHDTLLHTLPALQEWLRQEAGLLQTRELAQRETRLWQQHGESDDWLATPDKLLAYQALESAEMFLPKPVRHFVERSRHRVRRTTRIKQAAVGVIATLAVVASIAGWIATKKQHEAELQTAQTLKAQFRLLTEAAAEHLKDDDIAFARGVILEVLKNPQSMHPPDPTAVSVFQQIRANDPAVAVLPVPHGAVLTAMYSPDGTRIITASWDHTARIWDSATGIQVTASPEQDDYVGTVAYSSDGTRIVTVSDKKIARVWDAQSGDLRLTLTDVEFRDIAFSANGKQLVATSTQGTARIFDADTGKQVMVLDASPNKLDNVAFSPDGAHVVAASSDNTARIWNARTGAPQVVLSGHRASVTWVAYSPDGTQVLTASADGDARRFDAVTGRLLTLYPGLAWRASTLYCANFSADGARIVTASTDHTARVWDTATGAVLKVLSGHGNILWTAAFSPDGNQVVTGAADGSARIWDVSVGRHSAVLSSGDNMNDAEYSPDGTRLVTAHDNKIVKIWDAESGKEIAQLAGHKGPVNSAMYSPDGTRIVTASDDSTARIWDARTGEMLKSFYFSSKPVTAALYTTDGQHVVTVEDRAALGVWDVVSGMRVLQIANDDLAYITNIEVSPDGRQIVSTSLDPRVRIWDAQTGVQQRVFSKHRDQVFSAHYSSNGKYILSASADRTARIWDPRTGKEVAIFYGHRGRVTDAVFSPDGQHIATVSADNTLRIWDARTGVQLQVLQGHNRGIEHVVYSPDGTHLVTVSLDNTARIWDARPPPALSAQIAWAEAADSDPLPDVQRRQLGLPVDTDVGNPWPRATECDRLAGAFYDPARLAEGTRQERIDADLGKSACFSTSASRVRSAHEEFLLGRMRLANNDVQGARGALESAVAKGYGAARIDLADLLVDRASSADDVKRALFLYEEAWSDGVSIAASRLGQLYDRGLDDSGKDVSSLITHDQERAWTWYRKGADIGEPSALGRFAERSGQLALREKSSEKRGAYLLQAFEYNAAAAERANKESWPDAAWRQWRYRRATLARVLAREGMMQQVADAYGEVRDAGSLRTPTFRETLGGLTHSAQ
jgi:WD40 repeat protein/TPR repeat protein